MNPLLVAAIVVFLEGLAFGVILPLLTPYTEQLGGAETWVGFLFAASSLPRVFGVPVWGWLSDRMGRRRTMTLLSIGSAISSMIWVFNPDLGGVLGTGLIWLLFSRLFYGLFAANSALGMAVASDVSTPARRAASIGVLGAAFGLAISIGPAIGGIFGHAFGNANAGYLTGALQLSSTAVILLLLRETRPPRPADPDSYLPRAWLHMAWQSDVRLLLFVTLTSTIAYAVLLPTFPSLLKDKFAWTSKEVGYALSGFGLVGALVQGGMIRPLVRRCGERTVAILGLAILGGGLIGVSRCTDNPGFWLSLSFAAIGMGLSVPTTTGLISLAVPEHEQGAIHGLNQSATALGRAVGFTMAGTIYEHMGYQDAYAAAGVAALLALILLLFLRSNPHITAPAPIAPA